MDLFDIGATVILSLILLGVIGFWIFSVKMKNRPKRVHHRHIRIDDDVPPAEREKIVKAVLDQKEELQAIDWEDPGHFEYEGDEIRINRGWLLNERFKWSEMTYIKASIPKMEFAHHEFRIEIRFTDRPNEYIDEKEPGFYHFLTQIKSRFPSADLSFVESDRLEVPHRQFILYEV